MNRIPFLKKLASIQGTHKASWKNSEKDAPSHFRKGYFNIRHHLENRSLRYNLDLVCRPFKKH